MEKQLYIQPETCKAGQAYYLKNEKNGSGAIYEPVSFLSYRPCAAEVLVHDGTQARVVQRRFLFQKGSGTGKPAREKS